jgi:hypothetical protein
METVAMMVRRYLLTMILLGCLTIGATSMTEGQESPPWCAGDDVEAGNLRELRTVRVIANIHNIMAPVEEAEQVQLTEDDLRRQTEVHLRRMGLKVADSPPDWSYVYVDAKVLNPEGSEYSACHLSLAVNRPVIIKGIGRDYVAPVWDRPFVIMVPRDTMAAAIKRSLGTLLDGLENDWRQANPKE